MTYRRVPEPPAPPEKMCRSEVELSIWRAGWTFGYIAAQDADWQPDANYHDGECPSTGWQALGSREWM
jgi:hypothetical protein